MLSKTLFLYGFFYFFINVTCFYRGININKKAQYTVIILVQTIYLVPENLIL